jgi:hypothetical protein
LRPWEEDPGEYGHLVQQMDRSGNAWFQVLAGCRYQSCKLLSPAANVLVALNARQTIDSFERTSLLFKRFSSASAFRSPSGVRKYQLQPGIAARASQLNQ